RHALRPGARRGSADAALGRHHRRPRAPRLGDPGNQAGVLWAGAARGGDVPAARHLAGDRAEAAAMSALLEVRAISKSFRGLRAVHAASFEIPEGDINGLIGPNGAGKTTIFNMIAGVYAPDAGSIVFNGSP